MARLGAPTSPFRRAVTVAVVVVVLGLVVTAGALLRPQRADPREILTASAEQADAVCAVGTAGSSASASPSPSETPSSPPSVETVPSAAPSSSSSSSLPGIDPGGAASSSSTPASSPAIPPVSAPSGGPTDSASPSSSPSSSGPSSTANPSSSATPGDPAATPGAVPSETPSGVPSIAPLPSATATASSGRVLVVASGPVDTSTTDPTGRVTLGALGAAGGAATPAAEVTVDRQGRGATLDRATEPVLMQAEGTIAPTAVGAVLSRFADGVEAGLEAAPCLVPSTSAWLVGVSSGTADRTELVLSNPDDTEAAVDLDFFGRTGRVAVPGSPGVAVPAHASRSVSLSGIVDVEGPLTVSVRATTGRVAAAARLIRTAADTPAGADWIVPSATPATTVVVPAVPGEDGTRQLVVTNPTDLRADVTVQVLGLQGPFAPVGAETLQLAPDSTGTVELADGLAGTGSGVVVTSDQTVTAAVVSTSSRKDAAPDIAVQPSTPALLRTGVSAVATTRDADAELVLSNTAATDVSVHFSVLSLQGVVLRSGDILLASGGSATRRLASPAPSYVVVDVPDGSAVVGGVDLSEPDGTIAGLASIPLVSPDTSGPAPVVQLDPGAGR